MALSCTLLRIYPNVHDEGADGIGRPQDFSVNCLNCSITGDISLAGGGKFGDILSFTVDTPPDLLAIHPEFDFIQKWVAASVDNLTAHFEFGLNLTASNNTNELIVPLPSISISKNVCDCSVLQGQETDFLKD